MADADLADLAASPEAQLAAALLGTAMAPARRPVRDDGADFWGCGHSLDGAPAAGLDFAVCGNVGRDDRLYRWQQGDVQQARALRAVARWRNDGGDPAVEPQWARTLSPLLRAYVNGCDGYDLHRLETDLQSAPETLTARLREYRATGADVAADDPSLADVRRGPPPANGKVPLPSWRQDAADDDTPGGEAPPPPAPPGGGRKP